ncbi:MAG: serine/threonine-protein kinase, partial [Myxococcota bacterium]
MFAECITAGCDDYRLATLVRADGMARLGAGQRFGIEEYVGVLPDLLRREMTLDAVIDLSLGALVAYGLTVAEAVRQLSARHRTLRPQIVRAAALTLIVENATTRRPAHRKQKIAKSVEWTEWDEERFELVRLLGRGSFADVMLARDRRGAPGADMVALKILRRASNQSERELFMDEAAKTRRVSHPNVMRVLDVCEASAQWPWIAFEHLDGGTLANARAQILHQIGPSGVVRLLASICRGVQAIHEAGMVHCDIKPANIVLTSGLTPKVADLGVAVSVRNGPDDQN